MSTQHLLVLCIEPCVCGSHCRGPQPKGHPETKSAGISFWSLDHVSSPKALAFCVFSKPPAVPWWGSLSPFYHLDLPQNLLAMCYSVGALGLPNPKWWQDQLATLHCSCLGILWGQFSVLFVQFVCLFVVVFICFAFFVLKGWGYFSDKEKTENDASENTNYDSPNISQLEGSLHFYKWSHSVFIIDFWGSRD